jgi:hypothetical protein
MWYASRQRWTGAFATLGGIVRRTGRRMRVRVWRKRVHTRTRLRPLIDKDEAILGWGGGGESQKTRGRCEQRVVRV